MAAADAAGYTLQVKWAGCHSGGQRPAQLDVQPGERLSDTIDRLCDQTGMKWFMFAWFLQVPPDAPFLHLGRGTPQEACEVLASTLSELGVADTAVLLASGKMRGAPPGKTLSHHA